MDDTTPTRDVRPALRRSDERVLGGVCAGLAERLGVDPLFVRLATVLAGLVSGGLTVVAYLVAWVLIPPRNAVTSAPAAPARAPRPEAADPKEAWQAVGDELRTLVGGLRAPVPSPDPLPERSRSPLEAVDRVATAAGDRLRTPEVRGSARRLVTGLSTAVTTGVDDLNKRVRRSGD